jgi:hypothetical protein
MTKKKPKENLRTHDSYLECLRTAQIGEKNKETNKGVKGSCFLSCLKYFKPIVSTCIDYMHSILEGVVKSLFDFWFDSAIGQFCLKKYMQEIDNRLLQCRPPTFVPNTPRSIYTHNLWKAHEY